MSGFELARLCVGVARYRYSRCLCRRDVGTRRPAEGEEKLFTADVIHKHLLDDRDETARWFIGHNLSPMVNAGQQEAWVRISQILDAQHRHKFLLIPTEVGRTFGQHHGTPGAASGCSCRSKTIRKTVRMAQNLTAEHEQNPEATASGLIDDLKERASHLAERGASTVSDTLDTGREYVARIRNAGQDLAGGVYQSGHRKAEEAAFYAELGYEEARDWARSHPSQALGIAAGIGLLLGILVARR